ncbi:hypothetical protein GKE82_12650 [Conexibacter sp. W3-3-2]|uniref:cytochrome d ubiquinol oxidase subunit II n=1 Tax=Conexibacter sp. W3-3-2 TaxID=2675227 RepID=UPI0012B9E881|nr:cytochrome d ubiquinol oxidase subunit II [Conexibacter sp. W3-3-2]MTD45118.1 hypothetical protein [Conexibacter sp. W3-3-2]
MTSLETIWLVLVTGIWTLYLVLGGAELGVTMLLRLGSGAARTVNRQAALRAIGPTWQANDVWLICAIGAMFGAFPAWYAGFTEGLYLPLVVLILALIVRHAGIEFADHHSPIGRERWTRAVIACSAVLPVGWGVAWAAAADGSLARGGVDVLSWSTVLAGLALLALCHAMGAALLAHRTSGALAVAATRRLRWAAPLAAVLGVAATVGVAQGAADGVTAGPLAVALLVVAGAALATLTVAGRQGRARVAHHAAGVAVGGLLGALVAALGSRVIAGAGGVDLATSASGGYTLAWMTAITVALLPVLLWVLHLAGRRRSTGPRRGLGEGLFEGLR